MFWSHLGYALGLNMIPMTALWMLSVILSDVSIVDIAWSMLFVLTSSYYLFASGLFSFGHIRVTLVYVLLLIWAVRLAVYLLVRKLGHQGEDFRYQKFRAYWGARYWWVSYLQTFVLQSVFAVILSVALLLNTQHPGTAQLTWADVLGTLVWTVGFLFEAVGDYQMYRFKTDPRTKKGALYTGGVWRYSRHPNYCGQCVVWWGLWIVICAGLLTSDLSVATMSGKVLLSLICTPVFITTLLLKVSGVPLLEPKLRRVADSTSKEQYVKTSAFVPWFPRT
jgi:steroid 5-alpha reductase family enzyme